MKIFKLIALFGVIFLQAACTTPDGYLVWDKESQDLGRQAKADCGYLSQWKKDIGPHVCVREDRTWVLSRLLKEYYQDKSQYEYLYDIEICRKQVKSDRIKGQSPTLTCASRVNKGYRNVDPGHKRKGTNSANTSLSSELVILLGYRNCKAEITDVRGTSQAIYNNTPYHSIRWASKDSGKRIFTNKRSANGYESGPDNVIFYDVTEFKIKLITASGQVIGPVWSRPFMQKYRGYVYIHGARAFDRNNGTPNGYHQRRTPEYVERLCSVN